MGAGRRAIANNITDLAAALAYYTFLAIPAVLLVTLGLFSLFASPDSITTLARQGREDRPCTGDRAHRLEPEADERQQVREPCPHRRRPRPRALDDDRRDDSLHPRDNRTYNVDETAASSGSGSSPWRWSSPSASPSSQSSACSSSGPLSRAGWVPARRAWWVALGAQWPILIVGLLLVVRTVLYLGPNVERPRRAIPPRGRSFAVVIWLAASGLFSVYTSMFDSYNKTWGSLAGGDRDARPGSGSRRSHSCFGAEINAEAERSPRCGRAAAHARRPPGYTGPSGPVAQRIEQRTSNPRAEVRLLPGPCSPLTDDIPRTPMCGLPHALGWQRKGSRTEDVPQGSLGAAMG